jgi:hypothetical protein
MIGLITQPGRVGVQQLGWAFNNPVGLPILNHEISLLVANENLPL